MTKELRRLSIVMLAMFLALFGSTSWIQVVQADDLAENPRNTRALYDCYEVQRGSIIAERLGDRVIRALRRCVQFQRVYTDAAMWAPVTGYINPALGLATGIEQAMNAVLSAAPTDSQFLSRIERIVSGQPPRGSNVELSLDAAVQQAAYDALGDLQGAVRRDRARRPAASSPWCRTPSFDTNLLATPRHGDAVNAYDDRSTRIRTTRCPTAPSRATSTRPDRRSSSSSPRPPSRPAIHPRVDAAQPRRLPAARSRRSIVRTRAAARAVRRDA